MKGIALASVDRAILGIVTILTMSRPLDHRIA